MARWFSLGIRLIALIEAGKAALVLLAGFGLLALLHRDLPELAAELVARLHLNPAKRYPQIFIRAAARVTDWQLWMLAFLAGIYAIGRAIEAFGLWYERRWAEWFALASAAIYLPVELYELTRAFTAIRVFALVANLGIVLSMALTLHRAKGTTRTSA